MMAERITEQEFCMRLMARQPAMRLETLMRGRS